MVPPLLGETFAVLDSWGDASGGLGAAWTNYVAVPTLKYFSFFLFPSLGLFFGSMVILAVVFSFNPFY